MDSNRYVKRIVLTPNSEDVTPVEWRTERDYEAVRWSALGSLEPIRPRNVLGSIVGIRLDQWVVRIETEYRADFRKVASVVGKDKAAEVLRALGRPAPADWDRG